MKYGLEGSREEATSPEEVVRLLKKHSVKRVTFFGANPSILRALGNSSINVKIGLYNFEAEHLAEDSNNALQWVRTNISPFMRDTNITGLYVGADVRSQMVPLAMHLELAVGNLIDALGEEQLTSRIQVSFSSSMSTYSDEFPVASLLTSKIGQNQTFVIDIRNYWTPTFTNHRRLGDGRGFVWCVVRRDANVYDVQSALNWACARVNCGPTYAGGRCFIPNSIWDHSSWAFNAYFNSMNGAPESCNFSGTAYISSNDPSKYSDAAFPIERLSHAFNTRSCWYCITKRSTLQ